MIIKSKLFKVVGITLLMSFSASTAFADNIADELIDSGGLSLSPTISYDSASLRVSNDSSDITSSYDAGDSIRVDVGSLADGVYYYELLLSTASSDPENNPNGSSTTTQNGGFAIIDGVASANSDEEADATAEAEKAEAALTVANTAVLNSATED